jgi:hypothetical protein
MGLKNRIRKSVDRATFEADRVLRANRAQAEIATLNRRIDGALREIGERVVELHAGSGGDLREFGPIVERVQALRTELADKHRELEDILSEHASSAPQEQQATA